MDDWQNIAALTCVAAAAMYIVSRAARKLVKRAGSRCGGCASCGTSEGGGQPQGLVELPPPQSRPGHNGD